MPKVEQDATPVPPRDAAEPGDGPPVVRTAGGRFTPGRSGNPAGRPAGARGKAAQFASQLLGADVEAVLARAIRGAKDGEPVAMRLVIERLIPRLKSGVVVLDLPRVTSAADVMMACATVIEAAAAGEISLSEAAEFMRLLHAQRLAIETHDLAVRIDLLESGPPRPVGFK